MATRPEIAALLTWVCTQIHKPKEHLHRYQSAWVDAFPTTPIADLRREVEGLLDTHPERAPSIARVRARLNGGKAKAEVEQQETRQGAPEGCGRCFFGLREVAVCAVWVKGAEPDTRVQMVHCDCEAGLHWAGRRSRDGKRPLQVGAWTDALRQRVDPRAVVTIDPTAEQRMGAAEREAARARAVRAEETARKARERAQALQRVEAAHGVRGRNPWTQVQLSPEAARRMAEGLAREVDRGREAAESRWEHEGVAW